MDKSEKKRLKKSVGEINVPGVFVRTNSQLTTAWTSVVSMQDHLIRKMNEKAVSEIPPNQIFFWLKKCHEALIAVDELNQAMAINLRLDDIYKRSAQIEAIRSNIEAQEKADELQRSDGKGYDKD